jgi:hypothetical protein
MGLHGLLQGQIYLLVALICVPEIHSKLKIDNIVHHQLHESELIYSTIITD